MPQDSIPSKAGVLVILPSGFVASAYDNLSDSDIVSELTEQD